MVLDDPAHPAHRKSYDELSHYSNPEMPKAYENAMKNGLKKPSWIMWQPERNMVKDLLTFKVSNFQSKRVQSEFERLTGMRSVDLFIMPIQGSAERLVLERIAGLSSSKHATRDPILI